MYKTSSEDNPQETDDFLKSFLVVENHTYFLRERSIQKINLVYPKDI